MFAPKVPCHNECDATRKSSVLHASEKYIIQLGHHNGDNVESKVCGRFIHRRFLLNLSGCINNDQM